jgi:hypothetical protein
MRGSGRVATVPAESFAAEFGPFGISLSSPLNGRVKQG